MTSLAVLNRRLNSLTNDLSHRDDILLTVRNNALSLDETITTPDYGTVSTRDYLSLMERDILETFNKLKGTPYEGRVRCECAVYGLWPTE